MKKVLHILMFLLISTVTYSNHYVNLRFPNSKNKKSYSRDISINSLINAINKTEFRFVNKAKSVPVNLYSEMLYEVVGSNPKLLKQLEINSWSICSYNKIDNYSIYLKHYKNISRQTFDQYCQELNILMIIDGIISQSK